MAQKICPNCGCFIGGSVGYEQDDIVYCCEPCATGEGICECALETEKDSGKDNKN